MNRLFGSKTATPKPGLAEAIASTEARADGVNQKIKKLDQELSRYRDQMRKMTTGPGKVGCSPFLLLYSTSFADEIDRWITESNRGQSSTSIEAKETV